MGLDFEPKTACLAHILRRNVGPINQLAWDESFSRISENKPLEAGFFEGFGKSSVYDGVCSAHCLSFLSIYLRSFDRNPFCSEVTSEPLFKNLRERVLITLQNCPSDTQIRTYQAALNTIFEKNDSSNNFNILLEAKVRAICKIKDLYVESCSENSIDFFQQAESLNRENFLDIFSKLNNGAYLIRAIRKADTHKGEYLGHTMVFIKSDKESYFFDPSSEGGLVSLKEQDEQSLLYDLVRALCLKFTLNYPRFYEIKV